MKRDRLIINPTKNIYTRILCKCAIIPLIGMLAGCSSFGGSYEEGMYTESYTNGSIFAPEPDNYARGSYRPGTSTGPYYSGSYQRRYNYSPAPMPYNVSPKDEVKYQDLNDRINERVQAVGGSSTSEYNYEVESTSYEINGNNPTVTPKVTPSTAMPSTNGAATTDKPSSSADTYLPQ